MRCGLIEFTGGAEKLGSWSIKDASSPASGTERTSPPRATRPLGPEGAAQLSSFNCSGSDPNQEISTKSRRRGGTTAGVGFYFYNLGESESTLGLVGVRFKVMSIQIKRDISIGTRAASELGSDLHM